MTLTDEIRRAAAQYTAHPFAVTAALLLPVLAWFVAVVAALNLLRTGPPPADPAQAFADGVGAGLLVGTVAAAVAAGVLHLLIRKRRAK